MPIRRADLWRLVTEVPHDAEPTDIAEYFLQFLRDRAGSDVRLAGVDWTSRFVINQCVARSYRAGPPCRHCYGPGNSDRLLAQPDRHVGT